MRRTIPFIQKHIKPFLKEKGFIKSKYWFIREIDSEKFTLSISSVNFIDFQDIEFRIFYDHAGKKKVMERLTQYNDYSFIYNRPSNRIISFLYNQFNDMNDPFLGGFKKGKYYVATEEEALNFVYDLEHFLTSEALLNLERLKDLDVLESLRNTPDVFTSSEVKDVFYDRFRDGLLFSKLSTRNNLDQIFNKYWKFTNGWSIESKQGIKSYYNTLQKIDREELLSIYYEK